jgi:hypothetical protein
MVLTCKSVTGVHTHTAAGATYMYTVLYICVFFPCVITFNNIIIEYRSDDITINGKQKFACFFNKKSFFW